MPLSRSGLKGCFHFCGLLVCGVLIALPLVAQVPQEIVSTNVGGAAADGSSFEPDISNDGTATAFTSDAVDLDRIDTDNFADVYLRDHATGALTLLSITGVDAKADGLSGHPSVDGDGGRVAFETAATNLIARDTNRAFDIVVRDVSGAVGQTIAVSVRSDGIPGNGESRRPRISGDGLVVVFDSTATDLAPDGGAGGFTRVHIRDIVDGATVRLDPAEEAVDGDSRSADTDFSGSRIVFETDATNFIARDGNGATTDILLFDRETGLYRLISRGSRRRAADGASESPRISSDGGHVAFESVATNLTAGDTNDVRDVFVSDLLTGTIERVSVTDSGGQIRSSSFLGDISADGRFVVFSTASALTTADGNPVEDVYVRDRVLGRTALVSQSMSTLLAGDAASRAPSISGNGTLVSYQSDATDLLAADPIVDLNGQTDVYRATLALGGGLERFAATNHVLVLTDVDVVGGGTEEVIAQVRPDGTLTPIQRRLDDTFGGLAIDEFNAAWVLEGSIIVVAPASTLEPFRRISTGLADGEEVLDFVAAGGFSWYATSSKLVRVSILGDTVDFSLGVDVVDVSLSLDPVGNLWVSVARRGDLHRLLKVNRDLSSRHIFDRDYSGEGATPHLVRCDASGNVLLLASDALRKFGPSGAPLWTVPLSRADGLAIDGAENAFVFEDQVVVGISPAGERFFDASTPGAAATARSLAIDGEGGVWAIKAGVDAISRFDPSVDPALDVEVNDLTPGDQRHSDLAGFHVAHVAAREADSDGDRSANGIETDSFFNPFNSLSPDGETRLPAVIDLVATVDSDARTVALEWDVETAFTDYIVLRNGQRIDGNPFPASVAVTGVVDTDVPGGVHEYRVIGIIAGGPGGGGGAGVDLEEQIDDPYSLSEALEVTIGQGELLASVDVFDTPEAVAFDASNRIVAVALASGIIQFFDEELKFQGEIGLPVNPFANTEIRGIAFAPDDPTELFVTIENGEVYRTRDGGGDVDFLFTLPPSEAEEGYTGLDVRGDLFFITSGPGAECFIGLQISDGLFVTQGNSLSELLEEEVDHNAGVGVRLPSGDFLFGVGAGGSTIDRIVGINVSAENPEFEFVDAGVNIPLDGLGSQDLPDIAVAPGLGIVVADAWNSRICIVGAPDQLAPSPRIDQVTPERGAWSSSHSIEITGENFGDDDGDVLVRIDGVEVEIDSFVGPNGPVTVTAPASTSAREVSIVLQNSLGVDVIDPGFTYGFLRGNANDDSSIDVSDAVFTLLFLFAGGDEPPCRDAADTDDSGVIDMTDALFLVDLLFNGGPKPPAPFGEFGLDPSLDAESCGEE